MSAHCVQAFCYEIKREEKIREERSLGCFEGFSMIISIAERKKQSLVRARALTSHAPYARLKLIVLLFPLLPLVRYSLASQPRCSSICPIRPERQSRTVLSVIRPRGGPVRCLIVWRAGGAAVYG